MNNSGKYKILVVDDEAIIRKTVEMLLTHAGYEVRTAVNGFAALAQLRLSVPDLIVSDLNMPEMSGFELLSVVRRRYPEIAVIARSGAYLFGESVPGGVIADAFYPEGAHDPAEFLRIVAELLEAKTACAINHRRLPAPVWIPRYGKDSFGVPYIVITCTECLRSFQLSVNNEHLQEIQQTNCPFCSTVVRYVIDFSRDVSSPPAKQTKSIRSLRALHSRNAGESA